MHSFIHSFEREREKARKVFGQSSRPLVAAHANENKKETKRNAIIFRRRRRVIKETTKRERVWSQRQKETHFFHLRDLRDDFSTQSHTESNEEETKSRVYYLPSLSAPKKNSSSSSSPKSRRRLLFLLPRL